MVDPTDIRAVEANAAESRRREQLARSIEQDRLKRLLSGELGRWFLMDLVERAGVFRISFTSDPLTTAYNEGRRNEGLRLMNEILETCPELWDTMMRERAARQKSEQAARELETVV